MKYSSSKIGQNLHANMEAFRRDSQAKQTLKSEKYHFNYLSLIKPELQFYS